MVLGRPEAHEVEKVLLIVQSHIHSELLEYSREGCMTNQIVSPVLKLTLALEAKAVENLWLDVVSFEELKDAGE